MPGGKLTAEQFLTELSLGERLGNGTLRITTRQGFQLHGVVKGRWATIHQINEALLIKLAACGDVERNVMCCPAPHHNDGVHDRLQATADAIAQHLDRVTFGAGIHPSSATPREDFAIMRQFYLDMDSRSAGAAQRL